jgi:Flp pilus assembly pilin Flp
MQAKRFLRAEDGAVTVDWVVLTAAIVGLGLAVVVVVASGVEEVATDIDEDLTTINVTDFFKPARQTP